MKPVLAKSLNAFLLISLFGISQSVLADDEEIKDPVAHGEQLHNQYCVRCHTDSVYTRADHKVKSLKALNSQVARCRDMLGLQLFDEDTSAIVQFLNQKYYKF